MYSLSLGNYVKFCEQDHNTHYKTFTLFEKLCLSSLRTNPLPQLPDPGNMDLLCVTIALPFLGFHINGIIWDTVF